MAKKPAEQPNSSQWASSKKQTDVVANPAPTVAPLSGYTKVTLSRAVTVEGHTYRPSATHVVNEKILAALGDAVATTSPA